MTDINIYDTENSISRNRKTAEEAKKKKLPSKNAPKMDGIQTDDGADPTKFGDWTKNGRAIDF